MKTLILFLTLFVTATTSAQETRQHDAHAHGFSELNVVIEGNELVMELISPSANIVGFEYTPTAQEDIKAVERANESLNKADILFEFTAAAQCEIQHVDIESALNSDQHEHEEEGHEEEVHEDEGHDEEGHQDEGHEDEGHEDEEHEDEEHEDEEHEDEEHEDETHSEFHVQYEYHCKNAEELKELNVLLFNVFPLTETLNVQLLSNTGQSALTLNKDEHLIEF